MFCDHSRLRRCHKTAGQDVSLEYRRHTKASWLGSARHPEKFRRVEISALWLSTLNRPPLTIFLPRLAAWPTPHGRTVNCAPVHRYRVSFLPEIRLWLQHASETARHSPACIAMQTRKNHQKRFFGFRR